MADSNLHDWRHTPAWMWRIGSWNLLQKIPHVECRYCGKQVPMRSPITKTVWQGKTIEAHIWEPCPGKNTHFNDTEVEQTCVMNILEQWPNMIQKPPVMVVHQH